MEVGEKGTRMGQGDAIVEEWAGKTESRSRTQFAISGIEGAQGSQAKAYSGL